LRSSVRSKRLRTLRLPPSLDAARRLRCCDINCFWLKFSRLNKKRTVYISDLRINCQWLIWRGRAALLRSPNIKAARQRPPYQLFTT
jgi:hypothetical protein